MVEERNERVQQIRRSTTRQGDRMGGSSSSLSPPSPPRKIDEPWLPDGWNVFNANIADLRQRILSNRRRFNILLVGVKGTGKSSFVNSLTTATSEEKDGVKRPAEARSDNVSITTKMKHYKIGNSIWIHDMPGLEDSWMTPEDDTITRILDGKLPKDYDFKKSKVDSYWPSIFGSKTYGAMDAVIIVVEAPKVSTLAHETKSKPMEFFNRILVNCDKRDIRYGVVVTKIDEECPQTAKDIKKVYTSRAIEGVVRVVDGFLGIGYHRILPIKNYTKELKRDPNMERLILHSLGLIVTMMNDTADARDEAKSYFPK